jgi:hypothetical protein
VPYSFLSKSWNAAKAKGATVDVGGSRLVYESALPKTTGDVRLNTSMTINPEKLKYDLDWAGVPAEHAEEVLRLLGTVGSMNSYHGVLFSTVVYNQESVREFVDLALWLGDDFRLHFDPDTLRFKLNFDALDARCDASGEPISRIEALLCSSAIFFKVKMAEFVTARAHGISTREIVDLLHSGTPLTINFDLVRKTLKDDTALLWIYAAQTVTAASPSLRNASLVLSHALERMIAIAAHLKYTEIAPMLTNSDFIKMTTDENVSLEYLLSSLLSGMDSDLLDAIFDGDAA